MHQTRDTHRIRYLKVWKIFLLLHCEFENGKYQVRVVPISLSLYTSKHSSAATLFPLVLKTINFVLEVLIAILFDRSQFDGYYSGRGKFMPLPLKSKILETSGFLVTDYIKMFPLWLRTLNLQASLMVQFDLSRICNYSATFFCWASSKGSFLCGSPWKQDQTVLTIDIRGPTPSNASNALCTRPNKTIINHRFKYS